MNDRSTRTGRKQARPAVKKVSVAGNILRRPYPTPVLLSRAGVGLEELCLMLTQDIDDSENRPLSNYGSTLINE
jgi:hypothetical protein